MKHLQLSPPLLIITMGLPGSGKSFFARQFSEQYGLARVSEDRIRYELFENPVFNADESEIITRIMLYMIEQIMQTERPLVCEGRFMRTKDRKLLTQVAHANGYRTLIVWAQTDIQTSAFRAAKRDRRNPDSKYSFELDNQTFERLKNQLQRPSEKEPAVVISGKHAFKSQALTILRKIAGMYSESLEKNHLSVKGTSQTRTVQTRSNSQRYIQ